MPSVVSGASANADGNPIISRWGSTTATPLSKAASATAATTSSTRLHGMPTKM